MLRRLIREDIRFRISPNAPGTFIRIDGGRLAGGALDVDMRTIEVGDLTGDMAGFLKTHLRSDDFFDTERNPSARLEIVEATPRDAAYGQPNYDVRAAFTLLGTTKEISFAAVLAPHKPETVALQAYFPIDRTEWGVNYGSGKLYERLGMHLVNDEINLDVKIVAKR